MEPSACTRKCHPTIRISELRLCILITRNPHQAHLHRLQGVSVALGFYTTTQTPHNSSSLPVLSPSISPPTNLILMLPSPNPLYVHKIYSIFPSKIQSCISTRPILFIEPLCFYGLQLNYYLLNGYYPLVREYLLYISFWV